MKRLFLLLLVLASLSASAQDLQSLEARIQEAIDYNLAGKYEQALDLVYPKVFNIKSKQALLEELPVTPADTLYKVEYVKSGPNYTFGEIKEFQSSYYCLFEYDTKIKVIFNDAVTEADRNNILNNIRASYKPEQLKYDDESNSATMNRREKAIGICNAASGKKWAFIYNDNISLAQEVIQENARKELGL